MDIANPTPAIARFLPVLTHIQTHLGEDLSLERLAAIGNLSSFHFHRQFRDTVGETVKQYTQRLRLEQAAYALKMREANIIDIALNAGYRSHETFSRAFKRQFGLAPRAYRADQNIRYWLEQPDAEPLNGYTANYTISRPSFQELQPVEVAFIRHLGPYIEADVTSFDRLIGWAKAQGLYWGRNLLIGIGHDDPGITEPEKVRFDACIEVPNAGQPEGEIGFQTVPGGLFAVTSYVGPFGPTMLDAYAAMMRNLHQEDRYRIIGLPAIEIYRMQTINPDYFLNQTDIHIPVEKR
jgi:AraC family transcriptional regulator